MTFEACLAHVASAYGEAMSRDGARRVMERVDERAQRLEMLQGLDRAEALRQAVEQLRAEDDAAAVIAKRNQAMNLRLRLGRRASLMNSAPRPGHEPDLAAAIGASIHGDYSGRFGARNSAEARWHARLNETGGAMTAELGRAGLLRVVRNGLLDRKWGWELWNLSHAVMGTEAEKPMVTGDPIARRIAEIVHKYQMLARERLNKAGAWVGDYAGYITATVHDADRIRRAGFEAWRDFIRPLLDQRTFDDAEAVSPAAQEEMLRRTWHGLVTGVHLSDEGGVGFKDPAFAGPGNTAGRASQARVLHFRDADGWLDYQERFGSGNLMEQVVRALDRSARQESLMARWGTNPEAEFDQDIRFLAEHYRDSHPESVIRLRSAEPSLRARFDYLTGRANMPVHSLLARIGAATRAIVAMGRLGLVTFTHLSTLATKAAELREIGVGPVERYANFFTSLLPSGDALREVEHALGGGIDMMRGDMLSRFAADEAIPGRLAKMANWFFKLNGLSWLMDAQRTGMMSAVAAHLGSALGTEFDALDVNRARLLRVHGIAPLEWEALGRVQAAEADGRLYLTPDMALKTGLANSDDLALRLHAMMADEADRAIVRPGIRERAAVYGGQRPGTPIGEMLRFLAQFKLWGIASARQMVGRMADPERSLGWKTQGMVELAVATTMAGYAAMTLKQLVKGENAHPLDTPGHVWDAFGAALAQGGGYGVLGDYLFGSLNRFGQSPADSLAGPVGGQTASEIFTIYNDIKAGKFHLVPPHLLRVTVDNTPFANVFFLRTALDFLFLHSLEETLSPGYLERQVHQTLKNTGQTYWLAPTIHVPLFGR